MENFKNYLETQLNIIEIKLFGFCNSSSFDKELKKRKLRKSDKTKRVYKVPGSEGFIKVFAIVPFILLILGIIFTLFGDFSGEYISENMPLIIGVIVSFIVEEILVARVKNK